jgi:hypothetical protein
MHLSFAHFRVAKLGNYLGLLTLSSVQINCDQGLPTKTATVLCY